MCTSKSTRWNRIPLIKWKRRRQSRCETRVTQDKRLNVGHIRLMSSCICVSPSDFIKRNGTSILKFIDMVEKANMCTKEYYFTNTTKCRIELNLQSYCGSFVAACTQRSHRSIIDASKSSSCRRSILPSNRYTALYFRVIYRNERRRRFFLCDIWANTEFIGTSFGVGWKLLISQRQKDAERYRTKKKEKIYINLWDITCRQILIRVKVCTAQQNTHIHWQLALINTFTENTGLGMCMFKRKTLLHRG